MQRESPALHDDARSRIAPWSVAPARRRLLIPYQLVYEELGRPPVIPPRAQLIFDVDLVAVTDMVPRTDTPGAPPAGGQQRAGPRCPS